MQAMSTTMHAFHPSAGGSRRSVGVMFVIAIHILIIYGLVTGLHRDFVKAIPKILVAVNLEEEIPPPPPPPPPKPIEKVEAKAPEPKPEYMPPPEVPVQAQAPVQIEATPVPPPEPAVIAPPPPPVVAPAPAAPAAADIRVACPTMVKPEMPRLAIQNGTTGVVKATVLIRNGAVRDVTNLSGPKVFYSAVRAAMMQYKCEANAGDVIATQEFNFQLND